NGIHFHPPMHLWVSEHEPAGASLQVVAQLVQHDLDETTELVHLAGGLPEAEYRRVRLPGFQVLDWDGPEESIAAVLDHHVRAKEVWLAAIEVEPFPENRRDGPWALLARQQEAGPGGWTLCGGSTGRAPGAPGWSTPCATRRRASCSAASWCTCSPMPPTG